MCNQIRQYVLAFLMFVLFLFSPSGCVTQIVKFTSSDPLSQSPIDNSDENITGDTKKNQQSRSDDLIPLLTISIGRELYLVDFEQTDILPFPKNMNSSDQLYNDIAVLYANGILRGDSLEKALNEEHHLSDSDGFIPFDENKTLLFASNYIINDNFIFRPAGENYDILDSRTGEIVNRGQFPGALADIDSGSYNFLSIPSHSFFIVYSHENAFMLEESTWNWIQLPNFSVGYFEDLIVSSDSNFIMVTGDGDGKLWSIDGKLFEKVKTYQRTDSYLPMNYSVSSEMKFVAGYDYNGYIEVYDGIGLSLLFYKHTNCSTIYDIAFSPDNKYMVFTGFCDKPSWGFVDLTTHDTVKQFNRFDRTSKFEYIYLQKDLYKTIINLARAANTNDAPRSLVPKSIETLADKICALPLPNGYTYSDVFIGSAEGVPMISCLIEKPDKQKMTSDLYYYPDRQQALDRIHAKYESLQEFWEPDLQRLGEDDLLIITSLGYEYDFVFSVCSTVFTIRFPEISIFDTFLQENLSAIRQYTCNLN